jgi:hypothetical protein
MGRISAAELSGVRAERGDGMDQIPADRANSGYLFLFLNHTAHLLFSCSLYLIIMGWIRAAGPSASLGHTTAMGSSAAMGLIRAA